MAPILIVLTPEEVADAKAMAAETFARYRAQSGHYRNLERSHLVGKLGEVAVEKWLRSEGFDPDPAYRDQARDREPDILIREQGVEVKTWRPETWDKWGRCVTPAQARGMQKKSDAIVWAVADDEAEPVTVELVGWSTLEDVVATEPRATGPEYRPIVNHQLPAEAVRDLRELSQTLTESGGE